MRARRRSWLRGLRWRLAALRRHDPLTCPVCRQLSEEIMPEEDLL